MQLQSGSNLVVQDTILDYGDSTGAPSLASVTTDSELVVDRMIVRRTPTALLVGTNARGKFYGHAMSVFNSSVGQTAPGVSHRRAFFEASGADTLLHLENSVFANNTASIMQVGNASKGLLMHCSVANLDSGYAVLVESGSLQTTAPSIMPSINSDKRQIQTTVVVVYSFERIGRTCLCVTTYSTR